LFAVFVLLSDNFLKINEHLPSTPEFLRVIRFLKIACALPLELQMVLSNRAFELSKDIVRFQNREAAFFRTLGRFQKTEKS